MTTESAAPAQDTNSIEYRQGEVTRLTREFEVFKSQHEQIIANRGVVDGKPTTFEEQMELTSKLLNAQKLVKVAQDSLDNARKSATIKVANDAANSVKDALVKVLTDANIFDAMTKGEAGNVVTFTFTNGETGVTTNYKFATAKAATPTSNGAESGESKPAAKGQNVYVLNGEELSTRDFVAKYAQGLIDNGTFSWTGNPTDSVGLTHRADQIAEKLGATKAKKS